MVRIRIADLVTPFEERDPPRDAVVFSVSERLGIVPQDQLFRKKIALDDRSAYLRIKWGEVVYNPYLLWNRAVGVCFDKCGGCVSPAYVVLRPLADGIERFLHYFFRSRVFAAAVDAIASGSVTRRRTTPVKDILDLEFDLPSLPEQKAINLLLTVLDSKIELNQQMNGTLEEIAQGIFKSCFVDASQKGTPKGWHKGTVGDLVMLSRRAINPSEFPDEIFDHYSIPAYDEMRCPTAERGDLIKSNKFIVPPDAILLSKLNPRLPRIWLPKSSANRRSICSTEFLVITPREGISREYLYGYFHSKAFLEIFASLVTGTSTSHQRVKPEYLLAIDSIIPSIEAIQHYTQLIKPVQDRVGLNFEGSRTLSSLRDTLLPKFISGDLRVKDADRFIAESGT